MGFRLFRKTPEVTISVEGLRTSRGVFAANISRIAEIPRAMAPTVMRIPSGAASALGNKLAGQKKFNTSPSAIVAARALSRRLGIKKTGEFSNAISGENYTAADTHCGRRVARR